MKVGDQFVTWKMDVTKPVVLYTIELLNEEVVCLSYSSEDGKKNYVLHGMNNFGNNFRPAKKLTETKSPYKYDRESFQQAVRPMMEWISNNANPHTKVIIDYSWAELMSSEMSYKTEEFVRD